MNDHSLLSEETISNKIYFIRGQKVMMDSDLALLYGIETKALKQVVKRNLSRFPEDFMFELTKIEYDSSRSQIVTLKNIPNLMSQIVTSSLNLNFTTRHKKNWRSQIVISNFNRNSLRSQFATLKNI